MATEKTSHSPPAICKSPPPSINRTALYVYVMYMWSLIVERNTMVKKLIAISLTTFVFVVNSSYADLIQNNHLLSNDRLAEQTPQKPTPTQNSSSKQELLQKENNDIQYWLKPDVDFGFGTEFKEEELQAFIDDNEFAPISTLGFSTTREKKDFYKAVFNEPSPELYNGGKSSFETLFSLVDSKYTHLNIAFEGLYVSLITVPTPHTFIFVLLTALGLFYHNHPKRNKTQNKSEGAHRTPLASHMLATTPQ